MILSDEELKKLIIPMLQSYEKGDEERLANALVGFINEDRVAHGVPSEPLTYEKLATPAQRFLAMAGKVTMAERTLQGDDGPISVNEMLGMATRILVEQSKVIQEAADNEQD